MDSQPVAVSAPVTTASLRAWLGASLNALEYSREAIDSLNVFPIADGDTGTNMFLTVEACYEAISALPDTASLAEASGVVAEAAIWGARGNSGVILAEILRGIVDSFLDTTDGASLSIETIHTALANASTRAYSAVSRPVEGTILTVARVAAEAASVPPSARDDRSLLRHLLSISSHMHDALARTTDQLLALRNADVVDAGAQGLVVVYDALIDVVTGIRRTGPPIKARTVVENSDHAIHEPGTSHAKASTTGDYEVMFVCAGSAQVVENLRDTLDGQGDSLVVTGGPDLWSVHVHVDDPGAAVESILDYVVPQRLRITYLQESAQIPPTPTRDRCIVAVVHGPGVASLLSDVGVQVLPAQPGRRPSTGEIIRAIAATNAAEVIILPSDSDTIKVAEIAAEQARLTGVRASVIPTRSVVQTLAAVAVAELSASFDDVVVAMADASRATRYGAITVATKDAMTSAGLCRVGDVLGVVAGDVVEVGTQSEVVVGAILHRLLSTGGELVTLLAGQEATKELIEKARAEAISQQPSLDVVVIDAGQPLWPLIIGVE